MNKKTAVIILAAGRGTRMKSSLPKVLHPVLGKPMINYVVDAALGVKPFEIIPVVSWKREAVEASLVGAYGHIFRFAHQQTPAGTGDAIKTALEHISGPVDTVIVMSGDAPLITSSALERLCEAHKSAVSITTTVVPFPGGYGRIIRENGKVIKIVEEKDASAGERLVNEINAGLYCFNRKFLHDHVPAIKVNPVSGEYYLTDLISFAVKNGIDIGSYTDDDYTVFMGINSRSELSCVSALLQQRICARLMEEGVGIINPERVYIEKDVAIGADAEIYPDTFISGNTQIGGHAVIEQGAVIKNSIVGAHVHIKPYCVIENSKISESAAIGPFAHLRPETVVGEKAKIGNFVETKKATLKRGAKANHLSYIGDAMIEENVNIGAGTITCNYDGEKKHFTHIKKGAFVGTNTSLVAPVTVGEGAITAAGSVITKDVPDGALAVERAELRMIHNWHKVKNRIKKERNQE